MEQAKPSLCSPFERCPEIRARPLCFEPRGFGGRVHAGIAVDQAGALMALGGCARALERIGAGLALRSMR